MYKKISECRISGSKNLRPILSLGIQELTGVFPAKNETVTSGPLDLVWCPESSLVQLAHTYDSSEMYGDNYGYRSGLNQTMVDHLTAKIKHLERKYPLNPGDVVLDIGSNDGTTLRSYSAKNINKIGIDPVGLKFKNYYPEGVRLIPEFFTANTYSKHESKKAKVITSIAMLYDLESPLEFIRDIVTILADDGVWHFEQSYLPSMLRTNSYDTICHEHLEYYSLGVVKSMLETEGLKIIDVVTNSINGGSFAITATHAENQAHETDDAVINWLLQQEERMGLQTPKPYRDFEERVYRHRADLFSLIQGLVRQGKKVLGYGASTKGNVLLQFCGITSNELTAIAEVNPDKFGKFTPGTRIPIVSESDAHAMNPDYFLVLPWHFKDGILRRESDYLLRGGRFIFPFPEIEIV